MTLFEYADRHPVWTLAFLVVVSFAVMYVAHAFAGAVAAWRRR